MEWWGYAIVAGSILSQVLAWATKLKWSAEYKDAKEAQIKSLESRAQYEGMEQMTKTRRGAPARTGRGLSSIYRFAVALPLLCRVGRNLLHMPRSVPSRGDSDQYTRAGSFVASTLPRDPPR